MKLKNELFKIENILKKLKNLHGSFDYLQIKIASASRIKSWAERVLPNGEIVGEVLRSETINFRTHQPETYGLFCEKIFGPIKDWKCQCGEYNGFVPDKICEKCHVEIIQSRVRRYRMGYIDLTCPMAHLWYLKGTPSYLTLALDTLREGIKTSQIEKIIYYKDETAPIDFLMFFSAQMAKEELKNEFNPFYEVTSFPSKLLHEDIEQTRNGAEVIKVALENLNENIERHISEARSLYLQGGNLKKEKKLKKAEKEEKGRFQPLELPTNPQKLKTYFRRLRLLESFLATQTNLASMIFTILPVLPPSLRPLLELENGRLVAADVNEIYRLILIRNQRLFDFRSLFVPNLITMQGKKLLQECVDSLIDNARVPKERKITLNNKALKSLTEILEGKQGRFRQSLLGKRVDYSARSVIVVGPTLRLNQCGLPYQIGLELFRPFLIHELLKTKAKIPSYNTKLANTILKKKKPLVWTLLVKLAKKYSILLNRAPTLHRFGIQAFDPIIVLGQAIHLHPLVCTGFNADFDGDQMAVHLPLYEVSQLEIRTMMRPCYNVLSPANGEVILKPTQDMVIGCYYLTLMINKKKPILQKWFGNEQEALLAFYQKKINIHSSILVRYKIYNLNFIIEDKKLKFNSQEKNILFQPKEIEIKQVYSISSKLPKFYLLTNIGIFIAYQIESKENNKIKQYCLTDFFIETTPGRLIFSRNFNNIISS